MPHQLIPPPQLLWLTGFQQLHFLHILPPTQHLTWCLEDACKPGRPKGGSGCQTNVCRQSLLFAKHPVSPLVGHVQAPARSGKHPQLCPLPAVCNAIRANLWQFLGRDETTVCQRFCCKVMQSTSAMQAALMAGHSGINTGDVSCHNNVYAHACTRACVQEPLPKACAVVQQIRLHRLHVCPCWQAVQRSGMLRRVVTGITGKAVVPLRKALPTDLSQCHGVYGVVPQLHFPSSCNKWWTHECFCMHASRACLACCCVVVLWCCGVLTN